MIDKIITLRPHHINRFVEHYYDSQRRGDISQARDVFGYGKEFIEKVNNLFNYLASNKNQNTYILIRNGLDSICESCTFKRENCLFPDPLTGTAYESMKKMKLTEGFLYPLPEFLEKVKKIYPGKKHI